MADRKIVELRRHSRTIRLIHLWHIVSPGLILAEHIFQGLKRPLKYGEDADGDKAKLVYSWAAKRDWDWDHNKRFSPDGLREKPAKTGRIFAVIVTPNKKREYPAVNFWIEHWTWYHESATLSGAPVGWETRYDQKLSITRK